MNHDFGGGKLRSGRPASVFDAEDIQRQRPFAGTYDAVLGDDAVLLPAAHEFAGEEHQRPLAAVDQHEAVHRRSALIVRDNHRPAIASSPQALASFLADDRVARAQRLVQRHEAAGPRGFPAQHRKDGQVFVSHRVAEPPAIRFSRRATRRTCAAARHPHRPERRQRAKSQQRSRENRRHRKSLHKLLLILPSGPFAGLCGLNGAWGISCRVFSGCGRLRHTERWSMGQRGRGDFV